MVLVRLIAVAVAAGLVGVALFSAARAADDKKPGKFLVYFGTYTDGKDRHASEGVYRAELDLATGKLGEPTLAGKAVNPSFLALHPSGKFLYAVGEIDNYGGGPKRVGGVSAFAIDQKTGDLTLLNSQSSEGAGPCHVTLDPAGKFAFAANYSGGNACALPIASDGKLGKATGFAQHSADKDKKKRPLAHSINLDKAGKFAFVADAGLDKVFVYRFEDGRLKANDPPFADVGRNAAPRHFSFHPNGKTAYAINESELSVSVFDYDAEKGSLKEVQRIPTTPGGGPKPGRSTAEVVVHPSGKFVYGSNRAGKDSSIAVYSVEEKTGKLTHVENQGKGINTPRNFAIDPTGKYCLVGNQETSDVLVFTVDQQTGKLGPTDIKIDVGRPVCVRFLAWPR